MDIAAMEENRIEPEFDAAIRDGLCRVFPDDAAHFFLHRAWHGSAPSFSVVAYEKVHGRITVVAHAGVVDRTILVGSTPLRVAGIQNVFVLPEERGRGLSEKIMQKAMKVAAERGFAAGLLFCIPELEKVYSRSGWIRIYPIQVIRHENGEQLPLPGKNIAMYYPLMVQNFPDGNIDLRGNDW